MTRVLISLAWLVLVWVALWETWSWANLLGGLAAGALAVWLVPPHPPQRKLVLRPFAAIHLLLFFLWKLVEASAIVAWEVVSPRNRIVEGILEIELRGAGDAITTLVANAITLTPGTLTLEARRHPTVLYVHLLHLRDPEAARAEVLRLEELAIKAFIPDPAALGVGR